MHTLNGVLVNVSELKGDRDEIINTARDIAESKTDDFADEVFDWRETCCAGRWSDEYPENVILGKEDAQTFINTIKRLQESQKTALEMHMNELHKVSDNLDEIINHIIKNNDNIINLTGWHLRKAANIVSGKYDTDSFFYNTEEYNSRLTDKFIENLKDNAEKYAIVLFDYHI